MTILHQMWGVEPKRIAAAFAATAAALATMTARADDLPGAYGGHGVAFSYPAAWLHVPGQFQLQTAPPLWQEFFGPIPTAATPDPTQIQQPPATTPAIPRDVVALAAYHVNVAVTKKTIGRYKLSIMLTMMRLTEQAGGQMLSGPQRITMGGLPGYRFETTAKFDPQTTLESRLILVFKGKTEFFLNCQHVQDGPLTDEIESGCDQVVQSFKLTPASSSR